MEINLNSLYEYFEVNTNYVPKKQKTDKNKKSEEKTKETDIFNQPLKWPIEFLPQTSFIKEESRQNDSIIEDIAHKDYKASKIISILHSLTIELLREVNAKDLVQYDGYKKTQHVQYLLNFNNGIIKWFNTFEWSDIKKLVKNAELCEDFNLINLLLSTMKQYQNLSSKRLEFILFYKKLMESVERKKIVPLEWMLKDCADSNVNVDSEIASMRFCKIIDRLKEMKEIEIDYKLTEKYRHFAYHNIWQNSKNVTGGGGDEKEGSLVDTSESNLFLVLPDE